MLPNSDSPEAARGVPAGAVMSRVCLSCLITLAGLDAQLALCGALGLLAPSRRWLALAVLAAALASPSAHAGELDRITLHDGSVLWGRIVEISNGAYWIELEGGDLEGVRFAEVRAVSRGVDRRERMARDQDGDRVDFDPPARGLGGGFTVGSFISGRLRIPSNGDLLHHTDLVIGTGPTIEFIVDDGSIEVGVGQLLVVEFAFLEGEVHPYLGLGGGVAVGGYVTPAGGVSVGLMADLEDAVEFRLGALVGGGGGNIGVVPVVAVGWVWGG